MASVEIKYPRGHNTASKPVPRRFVAAGTATREIVRVTGKITKMGQQDIFTGEPLRFELRSVTGGSLACHWAILFPAPPPRNPSDKTGVPLGNYKLEVKGYDANGMSYDAPSFNFVVADPSPGPGAAVDPGLKDRINPGYPKGGEDITAEAGYFVPCGSCTHTAVSAQMNAILANSLYSDVVIELWYAVFPPLPPDTYQLSAEDSLGHVLSPSVTNLSVK